MALTGKTNDEKIWNYLKSNGFNEFGTAGLMGNLYAESGLKPTNLQNSSEKKLGLTDDTYTAAVDNGDYQNFVKDCAGYGLAQWTYWSRKQNLLTYVRAKKTSIGDMETQLNELYHEMVDRVNLDHLDLICEALDCSLDELIVRVPNKTPRTTHTINGSQKSKIDE